jgi:hypothetical protein
MSARVDREPCPYRIVDDAGGAFVFGVYLNLLIFRV